MQDPPLHICQLGWTDSSTLS